MSSAQHAQNLEVLYVLGSGRSGSTVFDITLGAHPEVCSVGELRYLPRIALSGDELCACGSRPRHCAFWSGVIEHWLDAAGTDALADLDRLQERVESNYEFFGKLAVGHRSTRGEQSEYAVLISSLYESIAAVSGRRIVLDSSKAPKRALALAGVDALTVRYIHLVRDVRGVAWSLKKSFTKNVDAGLQKEIKARSLFRTAVFWSLVNGLSEAVLRNVDEDRFLRLRYEDFVGSTDRTLGQVGALLDLDLETISSAVQKGMPVEPQHTIAGNRVRMASEVLLRMDEAWRGGLSRGEQAGLWLLTSALMSRYGYGR